MEIPAHSLRVSESDQSPETGQMLDGATIELVKKAGKLDGFDVIIHNATDELVSYWGILEPQRDVRVEAWHENTQKSFVIHTTIHRITNKWFEIENGICTVHGTVISAADDTASFISMATADDQP